MRKLYSSNITLIVLFFCTFFNSNAQNYPVQCTPIVTPPYSLAWTDYASSFEKFKVYLLLKDIEKPNVEVYIHIRLKGLGVIIENSPDFVSTKPIILHPGSPQIISGSMLAENFSEENLVAQGISIEELYQGKNLPAGFYQWEVTAYLLDQRQVSNTGVTLMTVFRSQPPTITYPANNAILPNTGFQSINFTWVSTNYYSVNAAQGTLYRLRLYEIPEEDEEADPNVVVNSGILPVFMTEVLTTNYLYSGSDPVLTPGKRYALQVQAMDVNGYDQFENNGFSQVVAFTYGIQGQLATQRCLRPQEVSIEPVGDAGVVVSWTNANVEALDYTLSYRSTNEDKWTEKITSEKNYTLLQLPASTYEFKVSTRCSYVSKSDFSTPQKFTIIQPPKESVDSTEWRLTPPSNVISIDTNYTSDTYSVIDVNPIQPNKGGDNVNQVSSTIDILNKPLTVVYDTDILPDSLKRKLPTSGVLSKIGSNATVEELKTALNTSKIDCASYLAGYTCGQHDAPSVPSGDIIQVKTGDEIAINSIAFEVVDLDGSGNGKGIVKVPMFNNAKLGVEFKNIKVAKGGCVVAGQAELSHIDVALLSEEQRKKSAEIYAAYNLALTVADSLAPEISETINNIGEFIQKLKNDVSNYVGGIQDAKKMKANFKFAEKYAETLLKDPTLPDSTRQKLSNAYQTALETKDFFCNGTDCNTTSKDGKGPNLIEELITPLCEQNKAKLLALNEALGNASSIISTKSNEVFTVVSWRINIQEYVPDTDKWERLTPEIFRDLCLEAGIKDGLPNNQAGNLAFITRLGRIFEDAVLRSLNREGNKYPFPVNNPNLTPKSVIPDAVAESGITIEENRSGKKEKIYYWWKNGVFIDAKFTLKKEKMIYLKGNNPKNEDQLEGFMEVLKNQNEAKTTSSALGSMFGYGTNIQKNASESEAAYLVIVTPHGVSLEKSILEEAGLRGIAVLQSTCEYFKQGSNVLFKVDTSTLKNRLYLGGKYKVVGTYGGNSILIDFNVK